MLFSRQTQPTPKQQVRTAMASQILGPHLSTDHRATSPVWARAFLACQRACQCPATAMASHERRWTTLLKLQPALPLPCPQATTILTTTLDPVLQCILLHHHPFTQALMLCTPTHLMATLDLAVVVVLRTLASTPTAVHNLPAYLSLYTIFNYFCSFSMQFSWSLCGQLLWFLNSSNTKCNSTNMFFLLFNIDSYLTFSLL